MQQGLLLALTCAVLMTGCSNASMEDGTRQQFLPGGPGVLLPGGLEQPNVVLPVTPPADIHITNPPPADEPKTKTKPKKKKKSKKTDDTPPPSDTKNDDPPGTGPQEQPEDPLDNQPSVTTPEEAKALEDAKKEAEEKQAEEANPFKETKGLPTAEALDMPRKPVQMPAMSWLDRLNDNTAIIATALDDQKRLIAVRWINAASGDPDITVIDHDPRMAVDNNIAMVEAGYTGNIHMLYQSINGAIVWKLYHRASNTWHHGKTVPFPIEISKQIAMVYVPTSKETWAFALGNGSVWRRRLKAYAQQWSDPEQMTQGEAIIQAPGVIYSPQDNSVHLFSSTPSGQVRHCVMSISNETNECATRLPDQTSLISSRPAVALDLHSGGLIVTARHSSNGIAVIRYDNGTKQWAAKTFLVEGQSIHDSPVIVQRPHIKKLEIIASTSKGLAHWVWDTSQVGNTDLVEATITEDARVANEDLTLIANPHNDQYNLLYRAKSDEELKLTVHTSYMLSPGLFDGGSVVDSVRTLSNPTALATGMPGYTLVHGGMGGAFTSYTCPGKSFLVGFDAYNWSHIGFICRDLYGAVYKSGTSFGQHTGSYEQMCPDKNGMVGVVKDVTLELGTFDDGHTTITGINASCRYLYVNNGIPTFASNSWSTTMRWDAPEGFSNSFMGSSAIIPDGAVIRGVYGAAGIRPDRMGFMYQHIAQW